MRAIINQPHTLVREVNGEAPPRLAAVLDTDRGVDMRHPSREKHLSQVGARRAEPRSYSAIRPPKSNGPVFQGRLHG